jgi:putative transposase
VIALRLTRATELVEAAVEETFAYYAFPEEHWRRIRTNNPLERILREIRDGAHASWARSPTGIAA